MRTACIIALTFALASAEDCFSTIQRLAHYDRLLGEQPANPAQSRLIQKQTLGASVDTTDEFVKEMKTQRSLGSGFSCGYTASWVTEVFYGLPTQYVRYRLGDLGTETTANVKAGYFPIAGDEVIDFFTRYATFNDRVVFHLMHSAPIDHAFVVEQLPAQAGYRLYQSYNSAHGLAAWLSQSDADLDALFASGDIMVNPKMVPIFNAAIQALFGPDFNVNNYMSLPDAASLMVPFIKAYLSYFLNSNTKASVLANLKAAKELYGQGGIISKEDFFDTYLPKLAALSAFFKEAWSTNAPTPQAIFDSWLEMYGVPNMVLFPNLPLRTIPTLTQSPATNYYLQAFPVVIPEDNCAQNLGPIMMSLRGSTGGRRVYDDSEDQEGIDATTMDVSNVKVYSVVALGSASGLALIALGLSFTQRSKVVTTAAKPDLEAIEVAMVDLAVDDVQ